MAAAVEPTMVVVNVDKLDNISIRSGNRKALRVGIIIKNMYHEEFYDLPINVLETLGTDELVLVKGGLSATSGSPNNGNGRCDGPNNGDGVCGPLNPTQR